MKILKDLDWIGMVAVCKHCGSRLHVEAQDLWFSYEDSQYYACCGICKARVVIKNESVPVAVGTAVLIQVNRTGRAS